MAKKTIQHCFKHCCDYLHSQQFEDAQLTVLIIFEYFFGEKYVQLLAKDYFVDDDQLNGIINILRRCLTNEPLAYILGESVFNGSKYNISPGVLIPRPETEELVHHSINVIDTILNTNQCLRVFECGVGSGVISIELAKAFPELTFLGWDISSHAIQLAHQNMLLHNVLNIQLIENDFFQNCDEYILSDQMTLLVSNPPYISIDDYEALDLNVKMEPKDALVADNKGLKIIFKLIDFAVKNNIILICEIGYNQSSLIRQAYNQLTLEFKTDLSGKDRFLFYFPSDFIH